MKAIFQGGAVLLLCLMLLMALSLLGLAAASDSQLQQRASGNIQFLADRQWLAERTLAWAETWLMSLPGESRPLPCAESCSVVQAIRPGGHFSGDPLNIDFGWWQSHAVRAGFAPDRSTEFPFSGIPESLSGYWVIEEIHLDETPEFESTVSALAWYMITAAAGSDRGEPFSISQSIVARPWGDAAFSNPLTASPPDSNFCTSLAAGTPCGRQAWQGLN